MKFITLNSHIPYKIENEVIGSELEQTVYAQDWHT